MTPKTAKTSVKGPRSSHSSVCTGVPMTPKSASTSIKEAVKFTRMCKFNLVGTCKRGSGCSFAHSEADLQEEPDFRKTTLCTSFSRGKCKMGNTCNFAHGLHELRKQVCEKGLQTSDGQHTRSADLQDPGQYTRSGDLQDPGDRLIAWTAEQLRQETMLAVQLLQELQSMRRLPNLQLSSHSPPMCQSALVICQPMLQPLVPDTLSIGQQPLLSSRQSTMQPPSDEDDTLSEPGSKACSRQSTWQPPSTRASSEDVDSDTDDESEQRFSDEWPVIMTVKNTFIHVAEITPSPRRSKSLPACLGRS